MNNVKHLIAAPLELMSAVGANAHDVLDKQLVVAVVKYLIVDVLQPQATELAVRPVHHETVALRSPTWILEWRADKQRAIVGVDLVMAIADPPAGNELPETLEIPAGLVAVIW